MSDDVFVICVIIVVIFLLIIGTGVSHLGDILRQLKRIADIQEHNSRRRNLN